MSILDQIVADKRVEIAARRQGRPVAELCAAARRRPAPPPFAAALRAVPMALIAEVKRRSPSAGEIRSPFDPAATARAYARAGAQAVSVLVDERHFGGGEEPFRAVRAAVDLPLLYKEFVVDPWQVWHAAALGASAVLLIAAVLDPPELAALQETCRAAGLETLVEVHNAAELRAAAALPAPCLGINNRDLATFRTRVGLTVELAPLAPPGCTLVSESGIRTPADVARVQAAGAHAVLVGEHLLRQPDPEAAARQLMGRP